MQSIRARPVVSKIGLFRDWPLILCGPFELKNGHLIVPDRPGQGIAWDEKAIARFAL